VRGGSVDDLMRAAGCRMVCVGAGAWQGAEIRTRLAREVFSRLEVLPIIGRKSDDLVSGRSHELLEMRDR
jgi:hypothetical protein